MDRYYPLHRRFRPAHRKRMPVKLRGRHIDLLTGFRCWVRFIFREHLSFVNTLKTLLEKIQMARQTCRPAQTGPEKYYQCIRIENAHLMMYKYVKND